MAEKFLTGTCPNCGARIRYDSRSNNSVHCPSCDSDIDVKELRDGSTAAQRHGLISGGAGSAISPVSVLEDSDSALAYLENYFANFNWSDYNKTTAFGVNEIAEVVEKIKIKNAAKGSTWLLEFKSLVTPLTKKLDALKEMEERFAEEYTGGDDTALLSNFDVYKRIVRAIVTGRNNLLKLLKTDIEFAEKFNLEDGKVAEMNAALDEFKAKIMKVTFAKEVLDIPSVKAANDAREAKFVQELAVRGIDAESTYQLALSTFYGGDEFASLDLFKRVRGYKKSEQFISKINNYFYFEDLRDIAGKSFTLNQCSLEEEKEDKGGCGKMFSVSKAGSAKDQQQATQQMATGLFPITDARISETPAIRGITQILANYGSQLYYIAKDTDLCCFDFRTRQVTKLLKRKHGELLTLTGKYCKVDFETTNDNEQFYIRARRPAAKVEQGGCGGGSKKILSEEDQTLNTYEIILVNMGESPVANVVVEKCVDVMYHFDKKIFYTTATKKQDRLITYFYMYDFATYENQLIFEGECEIEDVTKTNFIYSKWNPVSLNKDLYIYDFETKESTLLEQNIYDYAGVSGDKVFYLVGNRYRNSLFSINSDGRKRTEILQNARGIREVAGDWIYVVKGYYPNYALLKISSDGKNVYCIATGYKEILKEVNGYIYYLDYDNDLHVVRVDGEEDRVIATNIYAEEGSYDSEGVIIDDSIYYLRNEPKNDKTWTYSFYKMDLDGHNIQKIAFDVTGMKRYDSETICFHRTITREYEVHTTVKGSTTIARKIIPQSEYVMYNLATGEESIVYATGKPLSYEESGGCMKPSTTVKYTEVPVEIHYKRRGKRDIYAEDAAARAAQSASSALAAVVPGKGAGCAAPANGAKGAAPAAAANKGKAPTAGCGCAPKK